MRDVPDWWVKPVRALVGGKRYDLFAIGHVAQALERSSSTVRRWEREGAIPRSTYTIQGQDPMGRGNRRLYARRQVNLLIEASEAAGLNDNLGKNPSPDQIVKFGAHAHRFWARAAVLTDADLTVNSIKRAEMVAEEKEDEFQ